MNYKVIDLDESYNFYILSPSEFIWNKYFFKVVKRRNIYVDYLSLKMILFEKSLTYKVVDLVESYNSHRKFLYRVYIKKLWLFEDGVTLLPFEMAVEIPTAGTIPYYCFIWR
jgi:hypothetical protein